MLDALSDVHRRHVVIALLERGSADDPWVSIEFDGMDAQTRLEINHIHAPKLVEYGLIEWDEANYRVKAGPNFERIRPLLELLDQHEESLPDDWIRLGTDEEDTSGG
ncbi:MAG: ArsR family transcriptional regulator [Halobacteriota archaeon]